MIWESAYWKDGLLRTASDLEKRKAQRRWPEASLVKVEQAIMLAAYSMRKLAEARKVSDEVRKGKVPVSSCRPTGKRVTWMNWHKLDELYDLNSPCRRQVSVEALCNQLIHSYVFAICAGHEGLDGFYVSSDRDKQVRLLHVAIDDYVSMIRTIGSNYPATLSVRWNAEMDEYDVATGGNT